MVVETGMPATAAVPTQQMLLDLLARTRAVPGNKGLGVLYWEPQAYSWMNYGLSMWSSSGQPTVALRAFQNTPPARGLVYNPGFEYTAATQTPLGWTTVSGTDADADLTRSNGRASLYQLTHQKASAYQVRTFQLLANVPNGTYTLRAWAQRTGSQTTCQLYANGFGGPELAATLPVSGTWVQVQVPGIVVSNGQCEIGLRSNAGAGESASLDDVEFVASTGVASFSVDGVASAAEMGTGPGKYQLAGTYTGPHLDADRGLKALYVGYTATTLNLLLVGSAESATAGAYRALVLYLNTPARQGAPAAAALPGGTDPSSPLVHRPRLDQETDYGFRAVVGPGTGDVYFSAVSYVAGAGAPAAGADPYVGQGNKTGAVVTSSTAVLTDTKFAYTNTVSLAANANAGLEIEVPLSQLNSTTTLGAGSRLDLFAAFIDSNGQFSFTDVIPQVAGRSTDFGANPDFSTIPGTQSVGFVLGTGALASRSAVAKELDFRVYPNPATATSVVAYTLPAGRQPVSLAVYNALGQRVRSLAAAEQSGPQQFALGSLPAGAYLVKLQVGEQLTSQKVVVQ
jgi:hypothetical protein